MEELGNSINIIYTKNFDSEKETKFIARIKDYISFYFVKHEEEFNKDQNAFEGKFLMQLRTLVLVASQKKFWNIFMGNKFEYLIEHKVDEAQIILELDFPNYKALKNKKKLFLFQKQGINPSFIEFLYYFIII